jgi:hypothetical protein
MLDPVREEATNPLTEFGLLNEEQVIELFQSGKYISVLSAIFGEAEYRHIHRLAKQVRPLKRSAQRVYILPGLMGTRLGLRMRTRAQNIWLDLNAVSQGKLLNLALPSKPKLHVIGAMPQGYLRFLLTLRCAGYDARLLPYDWRQSVSDSGAHIYKTLVRDRAKNVVLIGHSMGGLVARAALAHDDKKRIAKIIQLGTPNFGSFAPVQALRAVYPTIRKLAALDPAHSAEQLSRHVFRTLPGIYELLPAADRTRDLDLFNIDSWPDDLLGPDATMLSRAREVRDSLGETTVDCHHIVGIDQETVTRISKTRSGFVYRITRDGDGTVPRILAEWPGAQTWYVAEVHGNLQNNDRVCAAICDLIAHDTTRKLSRDWQSSDRTTARSVSDNELRRQLRGKIRADRLSMNERRRLLEPNISEEWTNLVLSSAR